MIKIAWTSRHPLTQTQGETLEKIYGVDCRIVQDDSRFTDAAKMLDTCADYDVIAVPTLPFLDELVKAVNAAGGCKKVIRPVGHFEKTEIDTFNFNTNAIEKQSQYVFDYWEEVNAFEIKKDKPVPIEGSKNKVLWIFKSEMNGHQLASLKQLYGEGAEIKHIADRIESVDRLIELGEDCQVFAPVLPKEKVAELLTHEGLRGRPVIMAASRRIATGETVYNPNSGSEETAYILAPEEWEQIFGINIETKRL
jgi:hypothetical protein